MSNQFTEQAYYHDDMELWTGDCPDKILLTPEAAEWAFDGVPLKDMQEGVDYQRANDCTEDTELTAFKDSIVDAEDGIIYFDVDDNE